MPEETVGTAELATCDCEPCKRKNGLPHNVVARTMHDYSSTPRGGWRPRYTRDELALIEGDNGANRVPTFGIELETEAPRNYVTDLPDRPYVPSLGWAATDDDRAERDRALVAYGEWDERNQRHRRRQRDRFNANGNMTAEEAISMAAPRGLWHAKHDGSVSGPEFASQPGSLAYWRAQRGHLAGMFKSLLHGGMRSHDGDKCGFHINIGIDAFYRDPYNGVQANVVDDEHLARFARLITMNERWSTRMSQRTHQSKSWARFTAFPDMEACESWANSIRRHGYSYDEHTTVLNGSHHGRIEFRLPRGTLRLDRFYAKLEWAAAMVEYTRDSDNAVQPSAFMRWVKASGEYPTLLAYMTERFNAARFGEVE